MSDYTEIVDRLVDSGVIPEDLGRRLRPLPGLRSVLVHQYTQVDYQLLVDALGDLERFRRFPSEVTAYLGDRP